ncbi:MAG: AMP-binding protein [Alphaproteobacteria bacterium]|nr:AMP-binding protein [Alphaproteobacteria bacterium]
MFDLGHTFLATAERNPGALALVDGPLRLSYGDWAVRTRACAAGLAGLGLRPGDHLAVVLQNSAAMATLHWAAQLAGVIVTPLNWRMTAEEVDYCLADSEAKAVAFEPASAAAIAGAATATGIARIAVGGAPGGTHDLAALAAADGSRFVPRATAEDWSLMLYTSGTTGRPKGVPRRHRAECAAALAHVAQNQYRRGERTLGVMPLYHTMGVRSLLAMALIDGTFVCQHRFDPGEAIRLIDDAAIINLYLVPTLYHDILAHPSFARPRVASVRKLGFAGMSMTDGLLARLAEAFRPELFVNHYGSSEIYTFTIAPDAVAKPGSAGKSGINQRIRVVRLGAGDPDAVAAPGEEGEIVADLRSDEAFEGYWKRDDADRRAIRDGWYFTGDTGYRDADGDLFVTGRVDDMIISGGENVTPVEIESVLSLHPAVAEVAVAGLPDERWGARITAFVKRRGPVDAAALEAYCRASTLANFKRPKEFVFVAEIPKSPVGKILRRLLVAGEYERDGAAG